MKSNIARVIWDIFLMPKKVIYRYIIMNWKKAMLGECGKRVVISYGCNFSWQNVHISDDVYIGPNAMFMCTRAKIKIGSYVMIGPNVTIITGGHRMDLIGRYMISVNNSEKLPAHDQDIIIEGDNWIGANATILKGVTIGEGAVVAAGAVVTKNIPPYSIWGGVPAKQIGVRFNSEEVLKHKELIKKNH